MQEDRQVIPNCRHITNKSIIEHGGSVKQDKRAEIATICFVDHLHIQWDVKILRPGYFKIFKSIRGFCKDLWKEINETNTRDLIVNSQDKNGYFCDYDMEPKGKDFYYTAVFESTSFLPEEVICNLFWTRKDPARYHLRDFSYRLREPLPEPEKSKVETLEDSLLEEIELQKVKKKYLPKIQTTDIEAQFNFKDTLKKVFNKKRVKILAGREEGELSKDELRELMDIDNEELKLLRDDEKMQRLYKKYNK